MIKYNITSKRGKVYYWITRNKSDKCIVFIHGLTADHTLFDNQIDFWKREYTVITLDMPLHGESRPYDNFTFNNVAEDIMAILIKENINHIVIVGQSAGGYVAQAFYKKYSEYIDAFIGVDTTPFAKRYYKWIEVFLTRHFTAIARLYPFKYYCKTVASTSTYTEESYKSLYKSVSKLGKKGMLQCGEAIFKDFPNYDEVNFNCPVLLVVGEHDKIGYVKKYNEMWHSIKGYPLAILPNAAHNSNYDNYEDFNKIVYDFLQKYNY
ncbi:MAG: alpha/beta hydrolase [Clostridium sp.]|nr:alpha/beta hydrolase [Clostridium sp.]